MKRLLTVLLAGLFAQFMVSCYPEGADNIEDYDVAITNYDKNVTFSAFSTFSMPDTIVYFSNGQDAGLSHDAEIDESIIDLVASNFTSLGYTRISSPDSEDDPIPSFVVNISAFSNVNYAYYMDNWYNNWYWYWNGWWGNPFTPYYPWYPISVYSYRTGSVVVEMISTTPRSDDKVNVVWTGIADGLLQGSRTFILDRIDAEINQCFIQSPYLRK